MSYFLRVTVSKFLTQSSFHVSNFFYMEANECLKTHILYLYSVIGIYQFHVSESTLLGLDAGEHNPSTELVHVVLLQVLKLCRVAVDTSSFSSTLLRLVAPIHLDTSSYSLHICHDGYLQCHFGVGSIHVDFLEPNIGEHRTGRLQRKKDPHAKRPVHSRIELLL